MLTTRDVLANVLRELIQKRIDALKDNMAFGAAHTTFDAYREAVGQVRGLKETLELIDEAEKKVDSHERGM